MQVGIRGIIQYRNWHAQQPPHVDKATALFTCVLYLAKEGNPIDSGTTLLRSKNESQLISAYRRAKSIRAWFPDPRDFGIVKVKTVSYQQNRAVVMVVLPTSLHGVVHVSDFDRYSMQSFCELPYQIIKDRFAGWNDPLSPTGIFRGDI